MTPDERELRRALDARSGEPTPAFRARLSAALAEGRRPAAIARPVIARAAAVLLAVVTVAVLLLLRSGPLPGRPQLMPAVRPLPSTPTPGPSPAGPSPSSTAPTILASPIPMPTTAEFDAPSDRVVWALVGGLELFRSTDRGGTWQQRPLPAPLGGQAGSISFVDDAQGWLLFPGCQAGAPIWHTTDAGTTWQRLDAAGIAGPGCETSISFVDSTHGFVTGSGPNPLPVIYRTADGGRTWAASSPLPAPPGFTPQPGGYTLGAGRVRSLGSTLLVPAGGYVYRSTDGGASWTYLASGPYQAASIAFVTATRWLSLITPALSRETVDAGATWHAYASDYNQAAPVAPTIVFADPQIGYATVRGSLWRTLDGGLHWESLHTPGT